MDRDLTKPLQEGEWPGDDATSTLVVTKPIKTEQYQYSLVTTEVPNYFSLCDP